MQAFLSRGCGDAEDHAVLLCNLLLGFGLEAYVCVGTNSEGAHAWVLTRAKEEGRSKLTLWESLTGQKFDLFDPRAQRFYRTVDCVFNHRRFMANKQADNRFGLTKFMLDNEDCWKQIPPEVLGGVPSVPHGAVLGSTLDPVAEEKFLERALKDKVATLRRTETHLSTQWDPTLSYLLSPALANYELERVAGITFANEEF